MFGNESISHNPHHCIDLPRPELCRAPVSEELMMVADQIAQDVADYRRIHNITEGGPSSAQCPPQVHLPTSPATLSSDGRLPEEQVAKPPYDPNIPLLFQPISTLTEEDKRFYQMCAVEDALRKAECEMYQQQSIPAPVPRVQALRPQ
ncbi:hypothetical protein VNI00_006395 [Paramarasmius palmivorus]|uniref:Uncharacterized protein n=1 Tax=Paramarasmius palmivorus TaxID=297713 RepID=A0AAW0D8R8_9AGAR